MRARTHAHTGARPPKSALQFVAAPRPPPPPPPPARNSMHSAARGVRKKRTRRDAGAPGGGEGPFAGRAWSTEHQSLPDARESTPPPPGVHTNCSRETSLKCCQIFINSASATPPRQSSMNFYSYPAPFGTGISNNSGEYGMQNASL